MVSSTIYGVVRKESNLGLYGILPIRDYWRAIDPVKKLLWQAENDKLESLVDFVDVLYPCCYTFYDDRAGWVKYATANIQEARRLSKGKPVIVFLWPQYHNSNATLIGQLIPSDYWRLQLETAKQYADGVVIWGGFQVQWDELAPWWIETKDFISKL
jgi:hypothetical protein